MWELDIGYRKQHRNCHIEEAEEQQLPLEL